MKTSKTCDVKSCFLCQFCLDDWLPAISVHKTNYEVKKGQLLFKEGDPATGIYFVYSGGIKVHKRWDSEKELILRFAQKGDILGHMGLGKGSYYPVSATAIQNSIVCYVDMDFFKSTLSVNPSLAYNFILFLTNELKESEQRMRNLAHMPVKGRAAQAFITLKDQFGLNDAGYINIELTRQDLASFTGTAYETLFRVINDLIENKIIAINGKSISILNEEKLISLTNEASL